METKRVAFGIAAGLAVLAVTVVTFATAEEKPAPTSAMIVMQPMKLDTHPMQSLMPNAEACAVRISASGQDAQTVVTIGDGDSEMLSCVEFVEAAPLETLPGSIGLIYDVESGPGSSFRGAVILTPDADTGTWQLNEAYSGDLTLNADYPDLNALEEALRAR